MTELVDTIRDWNAQLPTRDSNAWLASKGGTASVRWPRPILWIAVALVALAVRRPRGSAPVLILGGVAALVLLVHALSQAPQSEFELPFVPVWIAAALVGLLAPSRAPAKPPYNHRRAAARADPSGRVRPRRRCRRRRRPRLALLADMCRFNALTAVKRAGSGHLGSTFSSLDLVVHLLWEGLNVRGGLRLAGSGRVLLLQGPRRPRALRGAQRVGHRLDGAAPPA